MAQEKWKISGDYFESCNCDVICGCLIQSPPSRGRCDAALAFRVAEGTYGQTSLNGLNAAVVVSFPGSGKMRDGNWTAALYVDERASKEQQEALSNIFTGQAGGPMQLLSSLISKFLGVKTTPITFEVEGKRRKLTIPNILTIDIEAVSGRDGSSPGCSTRCGRRPTSTSMMSARSEWIVGRTDGWRWLETPPSAPH